MNRLQSYWWVGILSLTMFSPVAVAQPGPQRSPEGVERSAPDRPFPGFEDLRRLDLTPEQQQQLAELRAQHQDDNSLSEDRQALKTAMEKLRAMIAGDDSASAIRSQHQEVKRLKDRLEARRLETMLSLREILTPEQRQTLEAMRRDRPRRDPRPQP